MRTVVTRRSPALLSSLLLLAAPLTGGAQEQPPLRAPAQPADALPSLAPLVESAKAAVVNVDVQARAPSRGRGSNPLEEFFGRGPASERERIRQGQGSGFIIDPRGLVLTNNHVVEDAVSIRVRLSDGRAFDGEVLGRDPLTDVALVKLKGKLDRLPVVRLGDSDALRVGDWVLAIGNPFGLASSVSLGIISGRGREIGASQYDDFLQTDAAINPGNSGGPLFNLRGEVIGINTAIVGGGSGVGFAVPSNLARALLPQLERTGKVVRGFLGVNVQDLTPELAKALSVPAGEGALIANVSEGSPAARAGLKGEDVVVSIDGRPVRDAGTLTRTVALMHPDSTARLTLYRGGQKKDVAVQLGTRPDLEGRGVDTDRGQDEPPGEARLGVALKDMDGRIAQAQDMSEEGALVVDVKPGSLAERAGLAPGMLVVEANHKPVKGMRDLQRLIRETKSGTTLLLRVELPRGSTVLRALTMP